MSTPIYISLAGSDETNGDYSRLNKLAASGGKARWSSLKGVGPGERVLIYCQRPHSAIVATAETSSVSKPGKRWPYEAMITNVKMVDQPIHRKEIAERFPEWPWAKTARGGTRPPSEISDWIWERATDSQASPECQIVFSSGAGFGDPINNKKVEVAAVKFATAQLEAEGYKVKSVESEKIGYDLEAKKRGSVLHVEVKGVSGDEVAFPITANEVRCGESDPAFRLVVVTSATARKPILHRFTWPEVAAGFDINPIAFMAKRR